MGAFAGLAGWACGRLGLWAAGLGALVGLWALFLGLRLWALFVGDFAGLAGLLGLCALLLGLSGLWGLLLGLWALVRSLGLVGACAGLAAFAGHGRLCALAGGRFCWACGRVGAAVGGRLLALLLGLVGACGRLGGRFCWAHHVWVGAFAGLLLLGLWALLLGLWGWALGAFAGLWALVGACGRSWALLPSKESTASRR